MYQALVINPWVMDFKLYDEWMHPIGLYFLIARLYENEIDTTYYNCLKRDFSKKNRKFCTGEFLTEEINKPAEYSSIKRKYKKYGVSESQFNSEMQSIEKPDIIFVGSMMTYWAPGVVETVQSIKRVFPDTPIVIGGIAATLLPDYFKQQCPDTLVFSGSILDLSTIEFPVIGTLKPFRSIPSILPAVPLLSNIMHAPALTSFGCPLRCSYCASHQLQPSFTRRNIDTVCEEIIAFTDQYKITDCSFYDDSLLINAEKSLIPILKCLQSKDIQLRFHVPNGLHIKYCTKELMYLMRVSGFSTMRFGYESGTESFRAYTNEKSNRNNLTATVNDLHDSGFKPSEIGIYIMAGFENQKLNDVIEEIRFVNSIGAKAQPVFLSPVPGTPVFEQYAVRFPQLRTNPLWHNDHFFITQLPGWSEDDIEEVRIETRKCNNRFN